MFIFINIEKLSLITFILVILPPKALSPAHYPSINRRINLIVFSIFL